MKFATVGLSSLAVAASLVSALNLQNPFSVMMEKKGAATKGRQVPIANTVQEASFNRFGDSFEVLSSKEDNDYAIRIKENDPSKLGIDTVKQWSGYLDYKDEKHFFYWFFESRNDPKNDPVILWLNGGPGCSSFSGLFFELGPASINSELKPVHNPFSWNTNASVIFLEQPIGVGFSYGRGTIDSTAAAGLDVYRFLELFFTKFPHLTKNDFHIAGESYAGHYIPQIAHEIISRKEDENATPPIFNLTSIMLGNSFTDPKTQFNYYEPMACGRGGHPSVLSEAQCASMNASVPRCEALNNMCYMTKRTIPCLAAGVYCEKYVTRLYDQSGLNYYDIRNSCENDSPLCYKELEYVEDYMNQKEVQSAVGSDVSEYHGCSEKVAVRFGLTGDSNKPFQFYVAELLDRAIPVLVYAGDKDYIANWLGNRAWTDQVGWRHTYKYRTLPLKPWVNKETDAVAGEVKSFGALTFLKINDSGHFVPHDQPENSHYMLQSWLTGNYKLDYSL